VHSAVRRMKGLDIIKVVWYSSHFHHAFAVIGCEALNFCTPLHLLAHAIGSRIHFLPVLKPNLNLSWTETRNFS